MYLCGTQGQKGIKKLFSSPKNAPEKPDLWQFGGGGGSILCLNKSKNHSFPKKITQTQFKVKNRTNKSHILETCYSQMLKLEKIKENCIFIC